MFKEVFLLWKEKIKKQTPIQLSNKNVYFATVGSVTEAMLLNVNDDKNIVIVSDGSVSKNIILEIYNYFYYKSIKVNLRDSKIEFQSLN